MSLGWAESWCMASNLLPSGENAWGLPAGELIPSGSAILLAPLPSEDTRNNVVLPSAFSRYSKRSPLGDQSPASASHFVSVTHFFCLLARSNKATLLKPPFSFDVNRRRL